MMTSVRIVLCSLLILKLIYCEAQSIDEMRVYPPYDSQAIRHMAEIAVSGGEIFLLLPVGDGENTKYRITTLRRLVPSGDFSHTELKRKVIDSLRTLPLTGYEPIPVYDFGIISSVQLRRFDKYNTCEIIDTYFDDNGLAIAFGLTDPIVLVVTELILRGVHVYPERDTGYMVDVFRYCGD